MNTDYYILSGKSRSGPYDLVAVVRKIRNGTLTAHTQLQKGESAEPKPAEEWAELTEFFAEKKEENPAAPERQATHRSLAGTLQNGWRFLQRNQYSTVFSGFLVLAIILVSAGVNYTLPPFLHVFAFMVFFVLGHIMLSCYLLSLLRMARGQPVDPSYMKSRINPSFKSLCIASLYTCAAAVAGLSLLISSLPTAVLLVGLLIFAVPGLFIMAIYAFAPLLILDKGYDFWEGLETSRKLVLKGGLENAGLIYALFVINFLAGLCFLLPLALSLPITMGAIAEMYDENFA